MIFELYRVHVLGIYKLLHTHKAIIFIIPQYIHKIYNVLVITMKNHACTKQNGTVYELGSTCVYLTGQQFVSGQQMSEDLHKVIFDLGEVDGRGLDGRGGVSFLLSVGRLQARSNDLIISISNHLQRSRGQVNKH